MRAYGPNPFGVVWLGLSAAILVLVVAALIVVLVLLVRFLVIATHAAQLYIDAQDPRTTSTTEPVASDPRTPLQAETVLPPTKPRAPRTPKPPTQSPPTSPTD